MQAGRRESEQNVTRFDCFTGDQLRFFRHPDCKTGDIVFAVRIESCHFSRLSANQGTAGLAAGPRNSADNLGHFFRVEFTNRNVIKKKQRFGALHQNIIDTHGHGILSYGIMPIHQEGQFQLGADAIRAGHQDRFQVFFRIQCE